MQEEKEILVANSEYEFTNAELNYQINLLENKANEYKMVYIEHIKYNEKIDDLIKSAVIYK